MKADQLKIGERYTTPLGAGVLYMIAAEFVKLRRDDGTAIKCRPSVLRTSKATTAPTPEAPKWDEV